MNWNWNRKLLILEAPLVLGAGVWNNAAAESLPRQGEAAVDSAAVARKEALDDILMFVVDKSSADAAAAQVRQRLEGGAALSLSASDRALMEMTSYFGSEALQKALSPLLPVESSPDPEELRPYETLVVEFAQALDDLASVLESVQDKATADRAAEMVENFRPYVLSLSEKEKKLPKPPEEIDRYMMGRSVVEIRPRVARLLQAWGRLHLRSEEYYDSSRLQKALPELGEVLENMNMPLDRDSIGEVTRVALGLEPLLREWLNLAHQVRDQATADAAAPRLQELAQQMRSLWGETLGRGYERELCSVNPQVELLMQACDRVSHHYAELRPPFFGSAALRDALRHEED